MCWPYFRFVGTFHPWRKIWYHVYHYVNNPYIVLYLFALWYAICCFEIICKDLFLTVFVCEVFFSLYVFSLEWSICTDAEDNNELIIREFYLKPLSLLKCQDEAYLKTKLWFMIWGLCGCNCCSLQISVTVQVVETCKLSRECGIHVIIIIRRYFWNNCFEFIIIFKLLLSL